MYGPTCFRPPLGSIQVHVKTVHYKLIFKTFKVTTQQNIQAIGRNIKATKCSNGINWMAPLVSWNCCKEIEHLTLCLLSHLSITTTIGHRHGN